MCVDNSGGNATPKTTAEWEPAIRVVPLAPNVLAVAVTRIEGTWKAYCGAVPGYSHDREWHEIRQSGEKLPHGIACAIFPEFADVPYAR